MHSWSLKRKSSSAWLRPQLGPNGLNPVPTYTQVGTDKGCNLGMALTPNVDDANTVTANTPKMAWNPHVLSTRCTSVPSLHNRGFDQANAFVDPSQKFMRKQMAAADIKRKEGDLPNLDPTFATNSVRSMFRLRDSNRSMKRRRATFDADNIQTGIATKIDKIKPSNGNEECDTVPRKRHCGRRLKRLFTRAQSDRKDLQPPATPKPEQPIQSASFDSAAASSNPSSATGNFVFQPSPNINFSSPSASESNQQTGHQPLRKRDYLRQSLRFHQPRARPHPRLQSYQYHGVPVFNTIASASPPVCNSLAPSMTAAATGTTHYNIYNQYYKRSMIFDDQAGVELGTDTDGEAENGSTLYETSQTGFSATSANSDNPPFKQMYLGEVSKPLIFTGLSTTSSDDPPIKQVYPGEAGKPLIFTKIGLTAAPAGEDSLGVKESVSYKCRYTHGSNNAACLSDYLHADAEVVASSVDGAERRTISKYFPSPDPSDLVSSTPDPKFLDGDEDTEIQSPPSNYSSSRSVSPASELTLPPPVLELTDTLGQTGLGIESDTTKSLNYHGTMRLDPPKQISIETPEFFESNGPALVDIYRNLLPPM